MNRIKKSLSVYKKVSGKGSPAEADLEEEDASDKDKDNSQKNKKRAKKQGLLKGTVDQDRKRNEGDSAGESNRGKVSTGSGIGGSQPVKHDPDTPALDKKAAPSAETVGMLGIAGVKKAAKFIMLMGKDEAAKVMKHLSPEEIEALAREIARVQRIEKEEAKQILNEFGVLREQIRTTQGGEEKALHMLISAFGEEKGNAIFQKAVPARKYAPFDFLHDLEVHQILILLKNESESVISIILPYLNPSRASQILRELPADVQKKVILRIAGMSKIDMDVIERIEAILKEKIRAQGKVVTQELDGKRALAEILKHMNISQEESILGELRINNPDLSDEIREKLFTLDVIFNLSDQDLQKILRDFTDPELAVILKGKTEEIQERILSNVSSRRQQLIEDELEHLGPMRKSEIDEATKEFLDYIRSQSEENKIIIRRGNDTILF